MGQNALAFECIDRIQRCTAKEQVFRELQSAGEAFGFSTFHMAGVPEPGVRWELYTLLSGWPAGWFERYMAQDYFQHDPVIWRIRSSVLPFMWSEAPYNAEENPLSHRIMQEARDFKLNDGFCVPIYTLHGRQAGVSLGGERIELSNDARAALNLIAIYAHYRAMDLHDRDHGGGERRKPKLSQREIEVLKWVSLGKTSWEIGEILAISERTANAHIENARIKLNATTRPQAVAEALRHGFVQ